MLVGSCRPTLDRHSAECRSPYRPIVSTDTRPTDALSTHDPSRIVATIGNHSRLYKTVVPKKIGWRDEKCEYLLQLYETAERSHLTNRMKRVETINIKSLL